ncbi:MAG: hypothetical protein GTN40_03515 [Candidatus Aenigmarchaeota archaeon]|nr:hypothetical protein [Candidatus Aenigmarchaeota archaeon]
MLHILKKLFIPHHHNDFRPHAFRHKWLTFYSLGLIVSQFAFGITFYSGPELASTQAQKVKAEIIELTNKERGSYVLRELKENPLLNLAAQEKIADMFENNYFLHISPDGEEPWDFISQSGYSYSYAGENLAKGFRKSEDVFYAWMQSPSHKDNILNRNYYDIGVAVASGELNGKTTTLIVQLFAAPVGVAPTETTILSTNPRLVTNIDTKNAVSTTKLPYFILWVFIAAFLIFDGLMLRRLNIFKHHKIHFHSSAFLVIILLVVLFLNFGQIL